MYNLQGELQCRLDSAWGGPVEGPKCISWDGKESRSAGNTGRPSGNFSSFLLQRLCCREGFPE